MAKLVRVSRFLFGEMSDQASYTVALEKTVYGLRSCKNMLIDPLSGVFRRPGAKYVNIIKKDEFLMAVSLNGANTILGVSSQGIKYIYGADTTIDIPYVIQDPQFITYSQWLHHVVFIVNNSETYHLDLKTKVISPLKDVCQNGAKPPWEGGEYPKDVVFHVDRFLFVSATAVHGANSSNTDGYKPYEFKEKFTESITYDSEGTATTEIQDYYSANSSFEANPLKGADSGFNWVVSGRYVLGGSEYGLWVLSDPSGVMSADNLYIKNVSEKGTANIKAVPKDGGFLYFQADYKTFAFFEYYQSDPKITVLNDTAKHLFEKYKPVKMVSSISPEFTVWILREDGNIVTYQQSTDNQVFAWSLLEIDFNVTDIEILRQSGKDSLMLKVDSEQVSDDVLIIDSDNKFLDGYEQIEQPEELKGLAWSVTIPRLKNKTVGIIAEDSKNRVSFDKDILMVINVDETGKYYLPESISKAMACVGPEDWGEDRIILNTIGSDSTYSQSGFFSIDKPEGELQEVINPNYAGYKLYLFDFDLSEDDIDVISLDTYKSIVCDNTGLIEMDSGITKAYVGLDYDSYIEPRVYFESHGPMKGRIISIHPLLVETTGLEYGHNLNKLSTYSINTELGESFSGQVDKLSINGPKKFMPNVYIKAAKGSNLHITSMYMEVE